MPPVVARTITSARDFVATVRAGASSTARTLGLVPTMGALHVGHARLIEQARQECSSVAVSIFVNPIQFDRDDDLRRYPRTFDADLSLCDRLGVDVIFAPSVEEMYPTPPQCTVSVGAIAQHLCGRFRPGHFNGVATVVLKLFDIVGPDRAYFGEKDAQQVAIVRRLVADFNLPLTIVGVPTVRERDGLAVSSRNAYLSPTERTLAPALHEALLRAERQIEAGVTDPVAVKNAALADLPADPALRLEYFEIVDPGDMQPVDRIRNSVRVAGAMWVGSTRLIDNVLSRQQATVRVD